MSKRKEIYTQGCKRSPWEINPLSLQQQLLEVDDQIHPAVTPTSLSMAELLEQSLCPDNLQTPEGILNWHFSSQISHGAGQKCPGTQPWEAVTLQGASSSWAQHSGELPSARGALSSANSLW